MDQSMKIQEPKYSYKILRDNFLLIVRNSVAMRNYNKPIEKICSITMNYKNIKNKLTKKMGYLWKEKYWVSK